MHDTPHWIPYSKINVIDFSEDHLSLLHQWRSNAEVEFEAFHHHPLRMKKAKYLKKWMYESSVRDRRKQHRLLLRPLVNSLFLGKTVMSWRSGEIGMMMNYIAHELKTVYEPDSGMTRSGNLGKKQKDCILPIREADGVVIDVCDLKNARLQWRTQLHRQFVAAVNALGLDSTCQIYGFWFKLLYLFPRFEGS
ncbi:hypothetical protein OPV22_007239 [Ensete ventricosum]|uniref:Uncharacterized protein n=1 Tax=Ensete ventricosum TaxID=4639 RepID=A0AAV8RU88_ENSVE|nr:hypothetical protein OPV22_007239 [Ensete ventricosum]